jgi:hypothetical protein
MLIYRGVVGVTTIPQGQPMAFLTPMSDRKVEIARHVISKEEWNKKYGMANQISFVNKYKNVVDRVKQFSDCPFHNHTKGN